MRASLSDDNEADENSGEADEGVFKDNAKQPDRAFKADAKQPDGVFKDVAMQPVYSRLHFWQCTFFSVWGRIRTVDRIKTMVVRICTVNVYGSDPLVYRLNDFLIYSCRIGIVVKAEEGGDVRASSTDDNADCDFKAVRIIKIVIETLH